MRPKLLPHSAFFFCTILLLFSCKSAKIARQTTEQPHFVVEIVQNGKVIPEINNRVQLKKAPFLFQLKLIKTDHVFLSASWGTYYYDYPEDQNIFECNDRNLEGCRFVPGKTGVEDNFNENKDLYVGNQEYQFCWFYDESLDWYRMDRGLRVEEGVIHTTVTVEKIFDMNLRDLGTVSESSYKYPMQEIEKDIYMVFATDNNEGEREHPEELQRESFILTFR